jgi:hypothetical protein
MTRQLDHFGRTEPKQRQRGRRARFGSPATHDVAQEALGATIPQRAQRLAQLLAGRAGQVQERRELARRVGDQGAFGELCRVPGLAQRPAQCSQRGRLLSSGKRQRRRGAHPVREWTRVGFDRGRRKRTHQRFARKWQLGVWREPAYCRQVLFGAPRDTPRIQSLTEQLQGPRRTQRGQSGETPHAICRSVTGE